MKLIPLSKEGKNRGKYSVMVDDEDYEVLNQWNWCASLSKKTDIVYALRKDAVTKKTILMHRQIMDFPAGLVDHKDRNGLNCQRENLRLANKSNNGTNRKKSSGKTSRFIGVSISKGSRKYKSQIRIGGKLTQLGFFSDEIEAAKAYNEAAKIHHGEFANLNAIPTT